MHAAPAAGVALYERGGAGDGLGRRGTGKGAEGEGRGGQKGGNCVAHFGRSYESVCLVRDVYCGRYRCISLMKEKGG